MFVTSFKVQAVTKQSDGCFVTPAGYLGTNNMKQHPAGVWQEQSPATPAAVQ